MIKKILINKVVNLLAKNFKLFEILKYVEEDNELDDAVREIKLELHEVQMRLEKLEK
tara:strand:+ start:2833 stop:3003 length:171 start_codon:yes stop_codon:yes gene_type:complete